MPEILCSVPNCPNKKLSRGLCNMHYQRLLKHGDPNITLMSFGLSREDRFWPKVDKSPGQGPKGECWMWTAGTDGDGYGIFGDDGNRSAKAHRVSYEIAYNQDPGSLQVLHDCDTPGCVNPRHLYAGTPMDNMQDKINRGRAKYSKGEDCGSAKLVAAQVKEIRKKYAAGEILISLASQYDVSKSAISLIVNEKTWTHLLENPKHRGDYAQGVDCGRAKLTDTKVRNIRKLHANGETGESLAKKYNVAPSNIWAIIHRKTWTHI